MAINDIYGNVIPTGDPVIESYYEAEMEDTIAKVRAEQTEPCLIFPLATDIHRGFGVTQIFGKMIANMNYFSRKIKCDFVMNLGDLVDGVGITDEEAIALGYDSSTSFLEINAPYLFAEGNHDNNIYNSSGGFSGSKLTLAEVFNAYFGDIRADVHNANESFTEYYVDFESKGIRVIVLNSCNSGNGTNYAYGSSTATWLASVLDSSKLNIICSHLAPIPAQNWNNVNPTNSTAVKNAIQSFVNNGGDVVQLCGHTHADYYFTSPWLTIFNCCQLQRQADITNEHFTVIVDPIDLNAPAREEGTATEDCWTVFVVKPVSRTIKAIRFGAGNDRAFTY